MSCIHPLIAFPSRKLSKNGKVQYIPIGKYDPELIDNYVGKNSIEFKSGIDIKPIQIPCGKCIGCRLDKSREWALRCMMELKSTENRVASFLTLTYSDAKIVPKYYPAPDTGEALPVYSLDKRDLQLFWKRLRKSLPDKKIRYFACGEYGSETWRPHYHAIVFNYWPDDLRVYERKDTTTYYSSDSLNKIWSHGHVIVAPVTFDTCAYVARYTAKKATTVGDEFFESHNMEPPFLVMSRRPGIGWSYFEDHMEFLAGDKIYVSGSEGLEGSIPRSFLSKVESIDPEIYEATKARRTLKGSVYERAIACTNKVSYSKLLADSEANLLARSKAIRRNKI